MPPKKEEAPVKKKKPEPVEPCGCGVNTFRAPPKAKSKKAPVPIEHAAGCSFQRAPCNRYPHLPKCSACEEGCGFCNGINRWCPHCSENRCKFLFTRDILGWARPQGTAQVPQGPGAAAAANRLGTADTAVLSTRPTST